LFVDEQPTSNYLITQEEAHRAFIATLPYSFNVVNNKFVRYGPEKYRFYVPVIRLCEAPESMAEF